MNERPNSRDHQIFILFKNIARSGSGRGRHYDQGILSVIEQIERDGQFIPSSVRHLVNLSPGTSPSPILDLAEMHELQRVLATREWTSEQWAEYANGLARAETVLKAYRKETEEAI